MQKDGRFQSHTPEFLLRPLRPGYQQPCRPDVGASLAACKSSVVPRNDVGNDGFVAAVRPWGRAAWVFAGQENTEPHLRPS